MQRDLLTRLKSRKFLFALANFIFVAVNEGTGGIIAFILGESYVDGKAAE